MIHPQPPAHSISQQWLRIRYRLRQFFQGLQARISTEEQQLLCALLPPAALTLFTALPIDAQRHGLNVLAAVRRAGFDHAELAMAALLHDVGKNAATQAGIPLGLWLRGPLVLLEAFWPAGLRRLGSPEPQPGWRYLLFVHLEHPRIGARWAQQAGCPPLACWLIEHHQNPTVSAPDEQHHLLLQALYIADESN